MGNVIEFARPVPTSPEAPTPAVRPNPRDRGLTKERYLQETPDPEIARDLLRALSDLNDTDRYAARGLADHCRILGGFTDNQRIYAVGLIWRAGRQANMIRCECCQGKGFPPAQKRG
jgi:hypothetical protein